MNRRHFVNTVGTGAAAIGAVKAAFAQPLPKSGNKMFRSINPGAVSVKGTFEETLKYARMGEFQGMDGSLPKLAELAGQSGAAYIKALYDEAGLRVGGMSLSPKWRGKESDFQSLIAELPGMAAVARQIGASGCMTWISPLSEELRFRDNFRFHVARLRPIAEILKDHGLRLGIEPVGPRTKREGKGYGFLYTIDGALGLAEAIGTGNVGLLLDSYHWYTALGTEADLASLTADDIVHVHINDAPAGVPVEEQLDSVRGLPGETGVIDLKTFLSTLNKIGYCGPVSPEPMSPQLRTMSPGDAAKTVGTAFKGVWDAAGI
jgi:sugar phosphate isomerase/epimerase